MGIGWKMVASLENKTVLYLDFESNMKGRTFLAGFDIGDGYTTWITDDALSGWADAKGMELATQEDVLNLVNEADVVIAYSDSEFEVLNRWSTELNIPIRKKVLYLNARKVAVAWAQKFKKSEYEALPELGVTLNKLNRPMKKSLISMIRLVGIHAWKKYGFGLVTKKLGQVEAGLRVNLGVYSKLTRHQKMQASKVLTHNRLDIEGMKLIVETALDAMPNLHSKYAKQFGNKE